MRQETPHQRLMRERRQAKRRADEFAREAQRMIDAWYIEELARSFEDDS